MWLICREQHLKRQIRGISVVTSYLVIFVDARLADERAIGDIALAVDDIATVRTCQVAQVMGNNILPQ